MPVTQSARAVNTLLQHLPRKDGDRILQACEPVELVAGATLCEADEPYRHAYFPVTAIVSLVGAVDDHHPMEMGLIGREGVLGVTMALGVNIAPLRGVVQGTGRSLRMTAARFRRELSGTPALLRNVHRYLYVLMAQLSQTTACTRFHETEQRLARWLLMTNDRAHADHFHLTHQLLADMLGVQRSAVTIAAGELQRRRFIRYIRGEIRVLDRKGLEAASCECYRAVVEDYDKLFV